MWAIAAKRYSPRELLQLKIEALDVQMSLQLFPTDQFRKIVAGNSNTPIGSMLYQTELSFNAFKTTDTHIMKKLLAQLTHQYRNFT